MTAPDTVTRDGASTRASEVSSERRPLAEMSRSSMLGLQILLGIVLLIIWELCAGRVVD